MGLLLAFDMSREGGRGEGKAPLYLQVWGPPLIV